MVLIKRYFDQRSLEVDYMTMLAHCALFMANYIFLIAEALSVYSIDVLSSQQPVKVEKILKNALAINICQSMIQVTNTMSRVLIFYVFIKLTEFCERHRMLKVEEEPPKDSQVLEEDVDMLGSVNRDSSEPLSNMLYSTQKTDAFAE